MHEPEDGHEMHEFVKHFKLKFEKKGNYPIIVDSIQVNGLLRTKDDIVSKHFLHCLQARSLEDLTGKLYSTCSKLERLNLFKNINIEIVPGEPRIGSKNLRNVELRVKVEEKRYRLKTGTEWQKGEISWV
jgi:outer membrane protein assembly factor BamA